MCNQQFNPRLAPLTTKHAKELVHQFPNEKLFISDMYSALTSTLTPQVNLLVMFTILFHQIKQGARGILGEHNVLYVPLSIVAKTGTTTWTRFRPQPVQELHTAFLSFMMAETNRNIALAVCKKYGVAFGQSHCCGVLFGEPEHITSYQSTVLYRMRNLFRSTLESLAMPVVNCTFKEIPEETIDLGESERNFFALYEKTFSALEPFLPKTHIEAYTDSMKELDIQRAWERIREAMLPEKEVAY